MTSEEQTPRADQRELRPAQRTAGQVPASRRTRLIGRGAILAVVALVLAGAAFLAFSIARASSSTSPNASGSSKTSRRTPTGVFAHVAKSRVAIHFPASPANMLAVGFHQAYNPKAYAFVPTGETLPIAKPSVTAQLLASDSSLHLFEQALRGRGSSERSAADCAVRPKSRLVSPVTGTVTLLKRYKLEGRIDDVQLEIEPDGAPLLRVVMIHIQDVTVKAGEHVVGGVTPVATVRHLTLDSSVNRYLPVSPADHTHIQVNDQRYRLPSS